MEEEGRPDLVPMKDSTQSQQPVAQLPPPTASGLLLALGNLLGPWLTARCRLSGSLAESRGHPTLLLQGTGTPGLGRGSDIHRRRWAQVC